MNLYNFIFLFVAMLLISTLIGSFEWMRHQEPKTTDKTWRKYLNMNWHNFRDAVMLGVYILGKSTTTFQTEWYQELFFLVVYRVNTDGIFSWWNNLNYFRIAKQSGNIWERYGGGVYVKVSLLIITLFITIFT
jgi:hypothetical protein